jgi:ABC-2 type transport system ATP-binding protein
MSELRLEVRAVSKWYGEVTALSEVTFTLGPGVTGLLGPNGAGKSTLLKLAAGLLRPSLGTVRLGGRDPFASAAARASIGIAPELEGFPEGMTGLQFVTAMLRFHGWRGAAARARARELIDSVGLTDARDRKAEGYSKGMRQRLKLAQALAHDPAFLILDEPLNGLDPPGRREVIERIRALGAEGRTVLVSSHVLHEVEAMTPRLLLLNRGRLLAEGEVSEIRDLMEDRPHQLWLRCADARAAASRLMALPEVESLRFQEEGFLVETRRPERFLEALQARAAAGEVAVEELEPRDENLQAVFDYLVEA